MAFAEDLNDFFDTRDFAVECVIDTAPPRSVNVIFSSPTEEVGLYEGSVEASANFLICQTADIQGVASSNTATIGGKIYKIRRIENQGTGTSRLHLKT